MSFPFASITHQSNLALMPLISKCQSNVPAATKLNLQELQAALTATLVIVAAQIATIP
jgi:hypothetical protein